MSSFSNLSNQQQPLNAAENASPTSQPSQNQALSSGYIQNIITKILSNICIIVNNVIVKFVEDDIVLSFNMKSAEFYSVNSAWEKSYVEVNAQNLHLRKMLQLNDVTICLDKVDNKKNSKINFYQDPLIYRCSIQSRFDFVHTVAGSNPNVFNPQLKLIKLNFYCRKFDVSITEQQLPMVIRLIELIIAIADGTLRLPDCDEPCLDTEVTMAPIKLSGLAAFEAHAEIIQKGDQITEEGWLSWAWSYVPSVSTILAPDEEGASNEQSSEHMESIEMAIGCYFDEFNICFKLNSQMSKSQSAAGKQSNFAKFLAVNSKGLALEVYNKKDLAHTMLGVSHVTAKSIGECSCKLCPNPPGNEIVILNMTKLIKESNLF